MQTKIFGKQPTSASSLWSDTPKLSISSIKKINTLLIYFDDKSIVHIKATYLDHNDKKVHGKGLKKELLDHTGKETFEFAKNEYIVSFKGKYSDHGITALTIGTSTGKVYEFETGEGDKIFSFNTGKDLQILMFYGYKAEEVVTGIAGIIVPISTQYLMLGMYTDEKLKQGNRLSNQEKASHMMMRLEIFMEKQGDAGSINGVNVLYRDKKNDRNKEVSHGELKGEAVVDLDFETQDFIKSIELYTSQDGIEYLMIETDQGEKIEVGEYADNQLRLRYDCEPDHQISQILAGFQQKLVQIAVLISPISLIQQSDEFVKVHEDKDFSLTVSKENGGQVLNSYFVDDSAKKDTSRLMDDSTNDDLGSYGIMSSYAEIEKAYAAKYQPNLMPNHSNLEIYRHSTEKNTIEKKYLRSDLFECVLYLGVLMGFIIVVSSFVDPMDWGMADLIGLESIGIYVFGLQAKKQQSMTLYNLFGGLMVLHMLISLIGIFISSDLLAVFRCLLSLAVVIAMWPFYMKYRKLLKEILGFGRHAALLKE